MATATTHREQQVEALQGAFVAFTQVSDRLAEAYHELEGRVATLTNELSVAQSERFRHLAEQERLAHRLHTLLNSLPAAVVVVDGAGRVQECNRTAQDWFGTTLLSRLWLDVAHENCAELLSVGGDVPLRDGRWVSVADSALTPEPGCIFVFSDVTEQRRLQNDVERHHRLSAMGEMVASLAHQIRTPLATALLYASNIADAPLARGKQPNFSAKLTRSLRQLEQLVNDMLVFAKGGTVQDLPISIAQLLSDLVISMEATFAEHTAQLVIPHLAPDVAVRGSEAALLGALQNLVVNALQAGGPGMRVTVGAEISAEDVILIVSDTGPGMADHIKERIFEPFFTTRSNGTGLGLSVVHAVVMAHRGMIDVISAPSAGTTFRLRLPRLTARGMLASGQAHAFSNARAV